MQNNNSTPEADTPATCMTQTAACRHTTSSSCSSCAGGWSPSARSRSPASRVLGRTLDTWPTTAHNCGARQACVTTSLTITRQVHVQIHDDALVDLLPQVRAEDLDEGDLQRRNLAVHEDAGQIQLHLETDVHVRAVDGG